MVKELCLRPERADCHDGNVLVVQLPVERAAVAQNERLACRVDADIGHRLTGGDGGDVDNLRAGVHVGNGQLAHCHERLAVEVHHVEVLGERRVAGSLKLSVAAAIDEQLHVCLRVFQQLCIVPEAFPVGQIQRNRAHREGDRLLQAFQPVQAAGNDPDFIERVVGVDGLGKDLAHAARRAGDDGDFFHIERLLPEDMFAKHGKIRDFL